MADYIVDPNQENVSTTVGEESTGTVKNKKEWSIDRLYENTLSADSLIDALRVTNELKTKYPNDETIQDFEKILRDEICNMFGGSIDDSDSDYEN